MCSNRVSIARLSLTHFRNYADAVIAPGPRLNILTGANGAGKTNILEALSLLGAGRGLRGAALSEVARQPGPGGFAVAARLDHVALGVGTEPARPDRRLVRIDGAPAAATALARHLALIWLTPAMDRLFTDAASERRRFLDRLVLALDPAHATHAARYDAAMRQRTRLLTADEPFDPQWLAALEGQMAEHGAALAEARSHLIAQLALEIAAASPGQFPRAALALDGWSDDGSLVETLHAGRSRDAQAGRALAGPHRTDLIVTHLEKGQPAARCSTGEQKALLLNILLAHADLVATRRGTRPVMLLDEVAAHLDGARRAALIERLTASGGQVWMTGTEPELFASADSSAARFHVSDATISRRG